MQFSATNCDSHLISQSAMANLNSSLQGTVSLRTKSGLGLRGGNEVAGLVVSVEAFVGMELSLVPEVEYVYVERQEDGKDFRVVTVVNRRDYALRSKVYDRERAIIEAYPKLNFDFHISARMDRDLKEIVYGIGKLAFER